MYQADQIYERVNVWGLKDDDPIITAYADAVAAMQKKSETDPTSWAYQAAIHGTYATPPLPLWNQCRHGSWYFVSWHRMYLYYFERIVRAQVVTNGGPQDWALPYWNYDGGGPENTLPTAFRNPNRQDGSTNPLYVAQRNPGINAGAGLPSSITSPAFALSRPIFTGTAEFGGGITSPLGQFWGQTGRLEQTPHNDVHVAIGGWMGDPDTAAQDPIFWLHHANIDRIWWLWGQQHADPTDPRWTDQSFDFMDVSGPASLTDLEVEDITNLSYTYQETPTTQPPPRPKGRRHVKWPRPWPERHAAPSEPAAEAQEPARQIVGATEAPVRLTGAPATVPVTVDRRTVESLAGPNAAEPEHRVFLDFEDISAEKNPGVVYGAYVNLPENPTEADLASHHVGNVSLFGVERARNPRGDEHAHGLRLSMEITPLLDELAHAGKWEEGERLDVTLRPLTLQMPDATEGIAGTKEGLAEAIANTDHSETPVTIGRVSVHFA
jgi:tyrosinase